MCRAGRYTEYQHSSKPLTLAAIHMNSTIIRILGLLFFSWLSVSSRSQGIDSAWMEKNIISRFRIDSGFSLHPYSFHDEKRKTVYLNNYRGKIVYISIWSTSCAPCIGQFPFQEQLLKRVKALHLDTSVIFVNINIEDTYKNWKSALKKYNPVGVNIRCSDTSLYDTWNLRAIPYHILLGPAGNILGLDIEGPNSGNLDWILYAAANGKQLINALWTSYNQNKLVERYRSMSAISDIQYAEWNKRILPYLLEFNEWRKRYRSRNSR